MKRLINVRVSLLLAVAFVLGIFACYKWLFGNIYFGLVVVAVLVALCVFCAIKRHGVGKHSIFSWKTTLIFLIFVILGFCIARVNYYVIERREVNGESVTVTGRVCDYGRYDESSGIYYLEDCTDVDSGVKYSGKIQIRYYGSLQIGDVLTVKGSLHSTYPIKGEVNSFLLRHSINYQLQDVTVILQEQGKLKLDETIRQYIYNVTRDYMPNNGGVMYALLTGDRGAMDDTVTWSFTRAGIAHLLAVSGLHVGFIVTLFGFALSKLRLHPLLECAILIVPLTLYAYICNFTPSVVRAIIMVVCSYVARACFGRYDLLTSLSWAALLILLVKPFYVFDVGFELSFLSVFGIATLYAPINRFLTKKNVNKHLRRFIDALAISASCTLATFFAVALSYNEAPILGVFVNIIAIPLVTVVFVFGLFGLLPWVFHYVLTAADAILQLVVRLAQAVARFDFAAVTFTALSVSVLIVIVLLFAIGGFINFKKLAKIIFYPMCAFLLVLSIVFAYVPKQTQNEAYVSWGYSKAIVAVVSNKGEGAIVGDFDDYTAVYDVVMHLQKYNLQSCQIYTANYADATEVAMKLAAEQLPVETVHVLTPQGNPTVTTALEKYKVNVINAYPNTTIGNSIAVRTVYSAGLSAVKISVGELDVCIVYDSLHPSSVLDFELGADVYVLPFACEEYSAAGLTSFTQYQSNLNYNYGANKYGNFTIKQKDDKILINFR